MKDILTELCNSLNINLIYTNDDSIILTSSTTDNKPTIVVNMLFYKCPEKIAMTIIEYCQETKNSEYNYDLIEKYAKKNLFSLEYIIDPPDENFKALLKKSSPKKKITNQYKDQEELKKDSSELSEACISSISYSDFLGKDNKISSGETIISSSETIIDLDIVISDNS